MPTEIVAHRAQARTGCAVRNVQRMRYYRVPTRHSHLPPHRQYLPEETIPLVPSVAVRGR